MSDSGSKGFVLCLTVGRGARFAVLDIGSQREVSCA